MSKAAPASESVSTSTSRFYLHHSGLEVTFVEKPSQDQELECSICLQLLRDPQIIGCKCGYSFCKNCIEQIQVRNCPLCHQNFHTALPNNRLSLILNGLLIYCSHAHSSADDGCLWTGKLGEFEQHLNQTPSKENRLDGCGFTDVSCQYCKNLFPRKGIETHEKETCPNKPYTCEYCGHSSVLDDIKQNHWPVCAKIPVQCPYECGENPQRQNLEHHMVEDCLSVPVDCEFAYAGCSEAITRGSMADHLRNNLTQHMALISCQQRTNQIEVKALKEKIMLNEKVHGALKEEVVALKEENKLLKDECLLLKKNYKALKQEIDQKIESLAIENKDEVSAINTDFKDNCEWRFDCLESRADNLESDMKTKLALIDLPSPSSQVEFTVYDMKSLRREREDWISEPFYSKSRYKMVLRVYPYGNGGGYGTHLSVFIYIIKGEYDHKLKWPFVGEVTLTLVDQKLGRHRTNTVEFSNNISCGRRRYDNSQTDGYGWPIFMEYSHLSPNYLKDDCVRFCIDNSYLA